MTFRITTSFDVRYNCPTGHNSIDGMTDVDNQTWICDHCDLPLKIEMRDGAGNYCVVERHPVNTLRNGDHIVYDLGNSQMACAEVYVSQRTTGKLSGTHWHLRVEGFGMADVPADQRVNRI